MLNEKSRELIIQFADRYLAPYQIKSKAGGDELIPQICPFCKGGSSGKDYHTFALSLDKGLYVCKRGSCGRHGRFSDLAKEVANEDIRLPSSRESPPSGRSSAESGTSYVLPQIELLPPTDQIYDYFHRRGISKETVDYFRIQSDAAGMIVFPFYERGSLIYVKYRRPWKPTPEELRIRGKEWQYPGTKPILFNLDGIDYTQRVYLTEGMIDAMALYEAGIHNVVSVPGGCDNMNWIANNWDVLEKIQQFVLFGDNDPPGRKMVQNLAKRLGEYRCLVVSSYPEIPNQPGQTCKDADEILVRLGEFELLDAAESAEEMEVRGLIDVGDIKPVDPTTIPRISTRIPKLDECLGGWCASSVVVLSGESGQGKSTLASQLLLTAVQAGHHVCAYSGELPKEKFLLWLSFQAAGYEYIGLKRDPILQKNVPYIPEEVQSRIQHWLKNRMFLYDNKAMFENSQAESIIELFTVAAKKYGCSVFLVD